jgi:hypothetical protein
LPYVLKASALSLQQTQIRPPYHQNQLKTWKTFKNIKNSNISSVINTIGAGDSVLG